ncbi:uncharacterized protein VTP21DRAFT_8798 [Calcarisporiella thermophila]|uniref:uncharacterized protein n=1 Tax=Calcarisporiella thermophila TaxID=911321 RepID=UPI003743445B
MTTSHLSNTTLDVQYLRELARKQLTDVLDSVRGKKALVLDPSLSGPLSLIAEFSYLKEHGVEKIYHLQPGPLETDCQSLLYICRAQIKNMKHLASHIHHHTSTSSPSQKYDYHLFFTPRRTLICERVLEEEGVLGEITMGEFKLEFIPFEDDVISLEMENSFRELFLDGDTTAVYQAAKALMSLQGMYGIIPRIVGKGEYAKLLADMLIRMRREMAADDDSTLVRSPTSPHIDSIIILDRSVDLITPLCTQLTYEGLIDEIWGIRNACVEFDTSVVGTLSPPPKVSGSSSSATAPPPASKKRRVQLNSGDRLYSQLRDLNFAVVGGYLNRVAKRINENYEERHQAKTITQIREFVGKLGDLQVEHQSLRTHTGIAEEIMAYTLSEDFNKVLEVQQNLVAGIDSTAHSDYLEELINKRAPLVQVLRLLCLQSLVTGGLKPKVYDHLKREILQTYGHEHLLTLSRLEDLLLFTKQLPVRPTYPQVRKSLRLIVDDVNEHQPNDISYVYSGYAPLSIRLVQCAVQRPVASAGGPMGVAVSGGGGSGGKSGVGWRGFEDVLRMIPGKAFDEVQRVEDGRKHLASHAAGTPRITLVFFLGGCTYTEISAIRFLAQQEEAQREFVVATTQLINGNTLMSSLMEERGARKEGHREAGGSGLGGGGTGAAAAM